jgi:hypothetical protein
MNIVGTVWKLGVSRADIRSASRKTSGPSSYALRASVDKCGILIRKQGPASPQDRFVAAVL